MDILVYLVLVIVIYWYTTTAVLWYHILAQQYIVRPSLVRGRLLRPLGMFGYFTQPRRQSKRAQGSTAVDSVRATVVVLRSHILAPGIYKYQYTGFSCTRVLRVRTYVFEVFLDILAVDILAGRNSFLYVIG